MAGSGGEDVRPAAADLFENEAEESGEGSGDEAEGAGDGADLTGFVADDAAGEAVAGGADGGGDDSSSESADGDGAAANDLDILESLGLNVDQVRPEKRPREGEEEGAEPEPKRQGLPASSTPARLELAAAGDDLFGDVGNGGMRTPADGGTRTPHAPADPNDLWEDGSDVDDLEDVVVQDSSLKRRRHADEAAEHNISEEQLQEICDIFGDTSVLKPIDTQANDDVMDDSEPLPSPVLPTLHASDMAADGDADNRAADMAADLFGEEETPDGMAKPKAEEMADLFGEETPDGMAKPKSKEIALKKPTVAELIQRHHAPERWIQSYCSEPSLLDAGGHRSWTEEEHTCETSYIFSEYFMQFYGTGKAFDLTTTSLSIRSVLNMLHEEQREPVFIITQNYWQFAKHILEKELWKIFDLDQRWQSCWAKYKRLSGWLLVLKDRGVNLPKIIVEKLQPKLFEQSDSERELNDLHDWFNMNHSAVCSEADGPSTKVKRRDNVAETLAAVRLHKFDQYLGMVPGNEAKKLEAFSMTPAQFGENLERKQRVHQPKEFVDEAHEPHTLCHRMRKPEPQLKTAANVIEAVCVFLSHSIAAEPSVRKFVREKFFSYCCISTKPTEAGMKCAQDASLNLRREYRAYHLVNRPISRFSGKDGEDEGDELFLDILELQRKGLLEMEYSLCIPDPAYIEGDPSSCEVRYRRVMLGHDKDQLGKDQQRLVTQYNQYMKQGTQPSQTLPDGTANSLFNQEMTLYRFNNDLLVKLRTVARSKEVAERCVGTNKEFLGAKRFYDCANMEFLDASKMTKFMTHDPILEAMQNLFCHVDLTGEGEEDFFIYPSRWNIIRKQIVLRSLRDELYPMLWAEVQQVLAFQAEELVCKKCAQALNARTDVQPYRLSANDHDFHKSQRKKVLGYQDSDTEDDEPWQQEKQGRMEGFGAVLSIVPDIFSEIAVAAVVNQYGDPVDVRILMKDFYVLPHAPDPSKPPILPGSTKDMTCQMREDHRRQTIRLIKTHQPAVILLPITGATDRMRKWFEEVLKTSDLTGALKALPIIAYGDMSMPRATAYLPRLKQGATYRDCEFPQQRVAISAARLMQDPVAEACQLWHDDPDQNGLLSLELHRLQGAVQPNKLLSVLRNRLMHSVAKAGVNVNRLRRSAHLSSVLPFVCGLGPEKAALFSKCLNDTVKNRGDLVKRLTKLMHSEKNTIIENCIPFMKICPLPGDTHWEVNAMPGLDRTRLHEGLRPWLYVLCKEALKQVDGAPQKEGDVVNAGSDEDNTDDEALFGVDVKALRLKKMEDNDVIAEAMKRIRREVKKDGSAAPFLKLLHGIPMDVWQQKVKDTVPEGAALDTLLVSIMIPELTEPFADQRAPYQAMDDNAIFYLSSKTAEDKLNIATLVHCAVDKDCEFEDDAGPTDPDLGQLDKRTQVKVMVLPHMIRGTFEKMYPLQKDEVQGWIPGANREFWKGEAVLCRIGSLRIKPGGGCMIRLSVDPDEKEWNSGFPLDDQDLSYFAPFKKEDWSATKLGLIGGDDDEMTKKRDWISRPRNIRHPNWKSDAHGDKIIQEIHDAPMGNTLFRPSTRFEIIHAYLKVRETMPQDLDVAATAATQCFRLFDIIEVREKSDVSGTELALHLLIEGQDYRDFDEIIACHMDPIMENLRALQEHARFGIRDASSSAYTKMAIREVLYRKTCYDPRRIQYAFMLSDEHVGHGAFVWALGGKQPKEELVEVFPDGFYLWGKPYKSLRELVAEFKKTGWRNSAQARKDWGAEFKKRRAAKIEQRGPDVLEDARKRQKKGGMGFGLGGLNTPSGMSASATPVGQYQQESSAPTPGGLSTPTGQSMSGMSTPTGLSTPVYRSSPGTPQAPGTPRGVPATPTGAGGRPMFGGQHMGGAPMTPAEMRGPNVPRLQPRTPATMARVAAGTPAGAPPATPAFRSGAPMFSGAPSTPAEAFHGQALPVPMTPRFAGTPAGAPPGTPGRSFAAAGTPAGPPPGTPAGMYRAAGTPAGAPPGTPGARGSHAAAGTPAYPPGTPLPGGAARTPAYPPGTPSPGGAAGTPAYPPGTPLPGGAAGTPAYPPGTPSPGGVYGRSVPLTPGSRDSRPAYPPGTPAVGTPGSRDSGRQAAQTPRGVPLTPAVGTPGSRDSGRQAAQTPINFGFQPVSPARLGGVPLTPGIRPAGPVPSTPAVRAAPGRQLAEGERPPSLDGMFD